MMINTINDVYETIYKNYLAPYISLDKISKEDWEVFRKHIETHKYLLNEKYKTEIPLSAAYESWSEYVMSPFVVLVAKHDIMKYTELNIVDLFKKMMFDWDVAKRATPKEERKISINHIVIEYCLTLNYSFFKKFLLRVFG